MHRILLLLLASTLACRTTSDGWTDYRRASSGTRHREGAITPQNVAKLQPAWTFHTGEATFETRAEKKSAFETTPILIDDTLFLTTPFNQIIALDPVHGRERWRFDPHLDREANYSEVTSRGVAAWRDERAGARTHCRTRIVMGTIDSRLIAVDAKDGKSCAAFGANGIVDLKVGIGRVRPGDYQVTSAPTIAGDLIVVGSSVGDNGAIDLERGTVRAFDARSGALRWSWDPIPLGDPNMKTGAANAWGAISYDAARNLVFIPTSSPSPDYYGGLRPGANANANSVVALRADSGAFVWGFQVVHHDLWDYDVAAQPILISFPHEGRTVHAVAVGTKMGHIFLLDRDSGTPIFPVEERPVPASDIAGEVAWPTQPFPTFPPPLVPARLDAADAWGPTDEDRENCRAQIAAMRSEGIFTPPSLQGTVTIPSIVGGVNWGGLSYDERRHILIAPTNNVAVGVKLIPRDSFEDARRSDTGSRIGGEFSPMRGAPYGMHRGVMHSPSGLPCNAPPWGSLTAIDLASKQVRWSVPLGTLGGQKGSINLGGTALTGDATGGVTFVAAAFDPVLRAFDTTTGALLWQHDLPASAQAAPLTYRIGKRHYVVIAAGGHGKLGTKRGDAVVAFALSE